MISCEYDVKEIKRIGIKKIVYVNGDGEINKSLAPFKWVKKSIKPKMFKCLFQC